MSEYSLISADSHFVEPPSMWAERLDRRFRDRAPRAVKLDGKPGEYIKRQGYATFINDPVFVNLLDWYPADNIMWSSDYPHGQATFPHSQDYVAQHLSKVSESDRRKIVHDTAAKFYGIN